MDLKTLASMIDGKEQGDEVTRDLHLLAKNLGYVIVYGLDGGLDGGLIEFDGAIFDEIENACGKTFYIDPISKSLFKEEEECIYITEFDHECKHLNEKKDKCKKIKANWCTINDFTWSYETDIPHETFITYDDDFPFCKGIVFDINNLGE